MEWPRVSICLDTKERLPHGQDEPALRALRSTMANVMYEGPLHVHIADDGSSQDYRRLVLELAASWPQIDGVTVTNGDGRGLGVAHNLALRTIHAYSGIVLCLDDAWELVRPLDLNRLVPAFFVHDWVACIRLDQLHAGDSGFMVDLNGQLYFELDRHKPSWTGGPRLETRRYQRDSGEWPEYKETDQVLQQLRRRQQTWNGVLWPIDLACTASPSSSSIYVPQGGNHAQGVSVPAIPGS